MQGNTIGPMYPDAKMQGRRVAVVTTRWNPDIVNSLVDGARRALTARGVEGSDIEVVTVPGAFEIPLCLDQLAGSGRFHALVAVGAVIRGDTPHFDFVAGECAAGVRAVSVGHAIPVGFGVLTTNNLEQAEARSGPGDDNKGCEAADAALDMLVTLEKLRAGN